MVRIMPMAGLAFWIILVGCVGACGGDDDSGAPPADASGVELPDSGAVGTPGEINCGSGPCDLADEECCGDLAGENGSECVASDTCEGYPIRCDGREDCTGGSYCCTRGIEGTECRAADMCDLVLCREATDCAQEGDLCCPQGVCAPDCE